MSKLKFYGRHHRGKTNLLFPSPWLENLHIRIIWPVYSVPIVHQLASFNKEMCAVLYFVYSIIQTHVKTMTSLTESS